MSEHVSKAGPMGLNIPGQVLPTSASMPNREYMSQPTGTVSATARRSLALADFGQVTRLNTVPKVAGEEGLVGQDLEEILKMQHRSGRSMFVIWNREEPNGNVGFFYGGIPSVGEQTQNPSQITLLYPPGGEGTVFDPEDLEAQVKQYKFWLILKGEHTNFTPAEGDTQPTTQPTTSRSLADLFNFYPGSGAIVIDLNPIANKDTKADTDGKNLLLATEEAQGANLKTSEITAESLESQIREKVKALDSGDWQISCKVGAKTREEVELLSKLVAAYSGIGDLSTTMEPIWIRGQTRDGIRVKRPFTYSEAFEVKDTRNVFQGNTRMVARLASPPQKEIAGVSTKEISTFSQNYVRSNIGDTREVTIGNILNPYGRRLLQELKLTYQDLLEGVGIFGLPGYGKTGLVTQIIEGVSTRDNSVRWMAIVTTKPEEMAAVASRIRQPVVMLRVGNREDTQVGINPFQPLNWDNLDGHLRRLSSAFVAGFMGEPADVRLWGEYVNYGLHGDPDHGIPSVYEQIGWDSLLGEPLPDYHNVPPAPPVASFRRTLLRVKEAMGFSDVYNNMGPFLNQNTREFRQGLLGRIVEGGYQLDWNKVFQYDTIVDLSGIGNKKEQSFIMNLFLMYMNEYIEYQARKRNDATDQPLTNLLVIDEAQNMLPNTATKQQNDVIEAILTDMRENRKRGWGYVLAAQEPELMHPAALGLPGTRVAFRMNKRRDYAEVAEGMGLMDNPEDGRKVAAIPGLRRGWALLSNQNTPSDPVKFETFNPALRSQKTDRVVGPDLLIDTLAWVGYPGPEFAKQLPNPIEKRRAEDLLYRTQEGFTIEWLGEFLTMATLLGLGEDIQLRPDIRDQIHRGVQRGYSGIPGFTPEIGRRIIGEAIWQAADAAINSRLQEVLKYLPHDKGRSREALLQYITLNMYNTIFGENTAGGLLPHKDNYAFAPFRDSGTHLRLTIADLAKETPDLDLGEFLGDDIYKGTTVQQEYELIQREELEKGNSWQSEAIEALAFKTILSPLSDEGPPERQKKYKLRIEALTEVPVTKVNEKGELEVLTKVNEEGEVLGVGDAFMTKFIKLLGNFVLDDTTQYMLISSMERMMRKYVRQMEKERSRQKLARSVLSDVRIATAAEKQAADLAEIKTMARQLLPIKKEGNE